MVQQLWAKVNARERFMVYGAGAVVLGWIVGMFLGSKNSCADLGFNSSLCSVNYFTLNNGGLFSFLALAAAIAVVVLLYLRYAPNMNITWPMPFAQLMLIVAAVAGVCALLLVLMQLTAPVFSLTNGPIFEWIADVLVVGGAAVIAWFAYQEWLASKTAA